MIRAEKLRAIVECKVDDLKTLAHVAGGHPASFYRGANFNDADLRGQDLRGFNLEAASFERARVDRHTKADEKYHEQMGMLRIAMELPIGGVVFKTLKDCGIKLERPIDKHIGDILEDAAVEFAKNLTPDDILPNEVAPSLSRDNNNVTLIGFERNVTHSSVAKSYFDMAKGNIFIDLDRGLIANTIKRSRQSMIKVSVTRRTIDLLSAIIGDRKEHLQIACTIILVLHLEKLGGHIRLGSGAGEVVSFLSQLAELERPSS
jgi:hypothetical protein